MIDLMWIVRHEFLHRLFRYRFNRKQWDKAADSVINDCLNYDPNTPPEYR